MIPAQEWALQWIKRCIKIKDKDFLTFEGLLSQSLNSIVKGKRQVDLMEIELNNTQLGNQIVDSSSDSPNLIGTKFIENYLVDLDFISKKILLADAGKKPQYLSFGISLAPVDNSMVIVNKLEVPQLSEIKLTDKIIKINNTDVSKVSGETFCEIKKLLDQNQSITIENESHETFTLQKKDVFTVSALELIDLNNRVFRLKASEYSEAFDLLRGFDSAIEGPIL